MLKTCSHELAHYIQLAKHGKSSCESDLRLGNRKYDEELAEEHRAQVQNYLRATGFQLGLLVNFGHYPKIEVERMVNTRGRYAARVPG